MHLFDLLKALGCAVAASAVGGGVSGDRGPATAGVLPRIGVKNCAFVDTATGRAFHPIGFNYIRLQQHPEVPTAKWHSPFGVGHYSYEEAEGMFEASSRHGFNTTRVFLSHFNFAPVDDSKSLNPEVMDNLIDFLRLAAEYKTYVILTTCYQLPSAYYSSLGANDNNAQGWNGHYLNDRTIKNKVAYLGQLTQEIKDRAPELLSTVLAYDLDNEVQFTMKHEPFKSGGEFAFLGEPYDLDTSSEIQKLMDVSMTNWIDLCSDAVKACHGFRIRLQFPQYRSHVRPGVGQGAEKPARAEGYAHPRPSRCDRNVKGRLHRPSHLYRTRHKHCFRSRLQRQTVLSQH